jgi:hypothetical protein
MPPVDIKLLIAVLIGVVSVTGAVITWQASLLSESATDHDRLSIAETVEQQQQIADAELLFANEKARAATYLADNAAADALEAQALATADPSVAQSLRVQADSLRAEAETLTFTGAAPISFVEHLDEETGVLDEEALRSRLQAVEIGGRENDPERNAATARQLRDDGLQLVRFLIPLALAIVMLTVANITARRRLRVGLVGVASVVWVVVVGLAVMA